MPRLASTPWQLTEMERSLLQQVVKRHRPSQQISLRVSIIFLAEEELSD